ncbi:MAG TPA: DUF4190 domain-containing protein [Aeromicrobium sp.]|jgi:hypothetical protein|nr:DUF4190 domain-containing protein [Aeromicrobium sp.]HKY57711.1 DUF4190 domain-containing protein [Aeromicrobium sp.]
MSTPEPPPYPGGDLPEPPANPPGFPPPPPPPPPPPGAPPHYSAPGPLPGSSKATTSLVTGIIGILCCGLLGIVAVITGKQSTAEAAVAGFPQSANAKAGIILGWIGIGLMTLGILAWIALFTLGMVGAMTTPTDY